MGMTLAELRSSRSTSLPSDTHELCLAQALVAEVRTLTEERVTLAIASMGTEDEPRPGRLGDPNQVRMTEIDARLTELADEMREHTGILTLVGIESGDWARWRDAHPARREASDENGNPVLSRIDIDVSNGWCDSTALLADLGRYAKKWNDEDLTPEDWEFIRSKAAPGDLKAICTKVVDMHEGEGLRAPKVLSQPSSTTETPETG